MALTYDISKELLYGTVGNHKFQTRAYSGGGRGKQEGHGPGESSLVSRLSTTIEDRSKGIHGGPLPHGVYICEYVAHHVKYHECVHLKTTDSSRVINSRFAGTPIWHGRLKDGDFYIHGRGKEGSDGCVVPAVPAERVRLSKAIKDDPATTLTVINASYALPAEADIVATV